MFPFLQDLWSSDLATRSDLNESWIQIDAGDVITQRSRGKLKKYLRHHSAYGHYTWQDSNLPWWAPAQKFTWPFDHVTL